MINVFVEFCSQLSLSEGLLFVLESADLVMSWHVHDLPKWLGVGGEKSFSKKSCGWSENFDLKEGFYYGAGQFFEGVTGSFWRK